jgi:hypothetical protein
VKLVGKARWDCCNCCFDPISATLHTVQLEAEKAEPADHNCGNDADNPAEAVNRAPETFKPSIDRCTPRSTSGSFDAIELASD